MDIENNEKLFFEKYNIQQQESTLEHREMLELPLMQKPYLDRLVDQVGEKVPLYKN